MVAVLRPVRRIKMVEADSSTEWRKASRCDSGSCVEFASIDGRAAIRDSKQPDDSPYLTFSPEPWRAFLAGVLAGEFDLPSRR